MPSKIQIKEMMKNNLFFSGVVKKNNVFSHLYCYCEKYTHMIKMF